MKRSRIFVAAFAGAALSAILIPFSTIAQVTGGGSSGPASTTKLGSVKCDGTTTTCAADGTITALAGGTVGINQVTGDVTAGPATGSASSIVHSIGGKAVSLGGTLTLSGAFSTIFNVTANTNLTLPTAGTVGTLEGTTTNDNAAAGDIGEYVTSSVASGSAVSLVNNTAKDVTTISLTAGDWNVFGTVCFTGAGSTTVSLMQGAISTTAATLGSELNINSNYAFGQAIFGVFVNPCFPLIPQRVSIAGTTTIHLVADSNFATSTASAFGQIEARRAR